MIAIIDYGMGNLRSVQKALEKVGAKAVVTADSDIIKAADKVVLPGVGAMGPAMRRLWELRLIDVVHDVVEHRTPFLGICLGLQLLFEKSDEGGDVKGLGILKGSVKRFTKLKVPHMGWNQVSIRNSKSPMFKGIDDQSNVYFCHSYYVIPKYSKIVTTTTPYGFDFVSSVCEDNLWGVQFHPEKSQAVGLQLLKNFVEIKR